MTILLDAGGALLIFLPILLIAFMVFTVLVEGWVLTKFNYGTFKKAVRAAIVANIASLIAGWLFTLTTTFHATVLLNSLIYFFVISVIIEGLVFFQMNKDFLIKDSLIASLSVNAISYLVLAVILMILRA